MRAFVALEVPEGFRRETAALARQIEADVSGRFPSQDTYHITLAFLGDISEHGSELAIEAIDAACEGIRPVHLHPEGLGKFGRSSDATLWLGLARDDGMMELASRVREELTARGVGFDGKAFKPHLTLARRARLPKGRLPELPFPQDAEATRVTLFKSTLAPEGATYKPLYTVELG